MNGLARKGLLFLATTALMVAAVGCPNSTVITGGVGAAQLSIEMTNPSRFDQGFFSLDRILFRPVDPGANQALGPDELTLLTVATPVDTTLPSVDPLFLPATQLGQGVYEIVEIRLSQLFFFDQDFPTDPSTCESYQSSYFENGPITVSSFATPLTFTVANGEDTMVAITIDVTEMISTLNDAYTCSVGCGAFCISNFNPSQFAADTLDYLSLE